MEALKSRGSRSRHEGDAEAGGIRKGEKKQEALMSERGRSDL